jgi:multiple sugar transport system ATP-binding protein
MIYMLRRFCDENVNKTENCAVYDAFMASVELRNLQKSFGDTMVLRDITLNVRDGELLALVGPSGCGKTTLLRILAGLDFADSGEVCIDGEPVDDLPPKRRDVAMVFQSYALYPYMSVRENMALPLLMRRMSRWQRLLIVGRWLKGSAAVRREIDSAVESAAAPLGLTALLDRRPAQLSGGQRQRVALGRAMVRHPKVFLMDEPLSNLDAKLRVDTRAEIAQLHRRLGATFVYVTHDQVEAMTMSDRVALMVDGRLLQVAPPQEIYDDPNDLRVAEFIGTPRINTLVATRIDDGVEIGAHKWPLRISGVTDNQIQLGVRPEWFELCKPDAEVYEGCVVKGALVHIEQLGSETLLHVAVPGQTASVLARVPPIKARNLRIGAPIALAAHTALAFDMQGQRLRELHWSHERSLQVANG